MNKEAIQTSEHIKPFVAGLSYGNKIWISSLPAATYIETLSHEIGHYLGTKLSFRQQVLTPDQVKRTRLPKNGNGSLFDLLLVIENCNSPTDSFALIDDFVIQSLSLFTKGQFDFKDIEVCRNVPQKKILKILDKNKNGIVTHKFSENGEMIPISCKEGRNIELPATATQRAVKKILENTIKEEYLFTWPKILYGNDRNSHSRARNIVDRAYRKTGIIIPSAVDIKNN